MNFFCSILILSYAINIVFIQQYEVQRNKQEPAFVQQKKVDSLLQLADEYRLSHPSKGLQYADQAILLSEKILYTTGIQNAYLIKGKNLERLQKLNQALVNYQHALSLAQKSEDVTNQVHLYNRIANIYRKYDQLDTAIFFQEKGVQLAYETEDTILLESTLTNLGYTYWIWGDLEKALIYYQEALQTNLKYGNRKTMASRYYGVAYCLHSLGKYRECMQYYAKAIATWREDDHESEVAKGLQNIGKVYRKLGYLEKAISVLEEAVIIYNNHDNHESAAYCYMLLGHIALQQQQSQVALKYYQNALEIHQELNNKYGIISSLISIGLAYQSTNDYPTSLDFFRQALERNLSNEYSDLLAYTYDGIASTQRMLHRLDSSIHYFNKALALRHQLYGSQHPDVSIIHTQLAKTYLKSKALPLALQHAQQALAALGVNLQDNKDEIPQIDEVSSKPLLLDALTVKADVLAAMDRLPAALQHYQFAIRYLMQHTLNGLDFSEDQLSMIDQYRPLFEGSIRTAYTLYAHTHQSDYLSGAFTFMEMSKAFLLRQALLQAQVIRYAENSDKLLLQENELKWAIALHEKELYDAQQARDTLAIIHHRKQVIDYQEAYHVLKDSLASNASDDYHLNNDTTLTSLAGVQSALDKNELLLSYFMGENHLYVLSLTQDTAHLFKRTILPSFNQHIHNIRKVLTDYQFITDSTQQANQLYIQSATWLFRQLIQQPLLVSRQPIHRLTVVPDGILNTIPFEALLLETPEDPQNYRAWPYLIKNYSIGYSYAAALPKSNHVGEKKPYTFAGFAPNYTDINLPKPPENNGLFAFLLRDGELPLPEAEAEVNAIADIMGGRVVTNATTKDFSTYAPQSQIIHFSGHALVDDQNNAFSHLLFTSNDTLENYYLYASDIYNMPLNAEMVVLSACNSGYGKVRNGEGVMSIARAFAYAGCQSLISSLWKVPDYATKNIMVNFYTHLADDMKKDQALQQAKLQYLQEATVSHAHPFYWAGFIAIGDMQPIHHAHPISYWYILGSLILLPVGIFVWRRSKE